MRDRGRTERPKGWTEYRLGVGQSWAIPFHGMEWALSWVAWALANWVLLDVLDRLGTFSVLIAVVFYFADSGNRLKQKHYQAWQVINTAQGKGGSGGRIEALQELNADHISLVGIDANGAFLQGISLRSANLGRCDFHAADLRNSNLRDADLVFCNLQNANFRYADLTAARLANADMQGADLHGARLEGVVLEGTNLDSVDLRETDLQNVAWQGIHSLRYANLWGVRNAPPEFLTWAGAQGAVSAESDEEWERLQQPGQLGSRGGLHYAPPNKH